jgi:hypothetical protein
VSIVGVAQETATEPTVPKKVTDEPMHPARTKQPGRAMPRTAQRLQNRIRENNEAI